MKIRALTICVNDADRLAVTLPLWMPGLASCHVIVDGFNERDILTARASDANVYVTNSFYTDDFEFNMGRALERARACAWGDWLLIFDCGLKPPKDWQNRLEALRPQCGNLYIEQMRGFDLFHTGDELLGDWSGPVEGWCEHEGSLINTHIDFDFGFYTAFKERWYKAVRVVAVGLGLEYVGHKQSAKPTNKAAYESAMAARAAKIAARTSNVIPLRGGA